MKHKQKGTKNPRVPSKVLSKTISSDFLKIAKEVGKTYQSAFKKLAN